MGGCTTTSKLFAHRVLTTCARTRPASASPPPTLQNFYVEHPAITARSDAEIEMYRRQHELTVQGTDVPKPVTRFEESPFPEYVLAEIYKNGA